MPDYEFTDETTTEDDNEQAGRTAFVSISLLCLFIGAIIGTAIQPIIGKLMSNADTRTIEESTSAILPLGDTEKSGKNPVIYVARRLRPSVLNIRVKTKSTVPGPFNFQNQEKNQGIGSGVAIRSDGYIITNAHVVENADEILVTLADGTDLKAKLIGSDQENDIAVVKIKGRSLIPAKILKNTPQVGSMVVAIGSPWELDQSVTSGIISALHRKLSVPSSKGDKFYPNLIQTDAAINPGSSGGALSDEKGNLIGINTLIYSQSGGYEGVSFAIPIDDAMEAANQIINKGRVNHPYIGISGQDVTDNIAKRHKLAEPRGAMLVDVMSGSSAEKAGLKNGDIVIEADGVKVKKMDDVVAAIRAHEIGEDIELEFIRNNLTRQTSVKVTEKPPGIK